MVLQLGLFKCFFKRCSGSILGIKNLRSLYEWEVESRKLDKIKHVITNIPDVEKIDSGSGVYIGIHEIKYSVGVTYNLDER